MYYGTQILEDAGFTTQVALVANVANGVISVLATFVGIWLLGRVGCRPLLIGGLLGTTSSLLLIGIFSQVLGEASLLPYVVLTLTVTFLAFQQGAVSPVTWLILSAIFPLKLRGIGMGFSVFWMWITNFAIGFLFPMLLNTFGLSSTFFIFAVLGLGAIAFIYQFMPEIKGQSLEDIEHYFKQLGQKKTMAKRT